MTLVFQIIVCLSGLIAIFTGANDYWQGATLQGDFGDLKEHAQSSLPNFTIRFLGAIWMGFGVLLILFSTNLKQYELPLIVAFCFVILGGLGRLLTIYKLGMPEMSTSMVYFILGIELVLFPVLLIWLLVMDLK